MFRKSKVGTAVAVLVGGSLFATAMPLLAQSGERVEITGSRIKRIEAETSQPVYSISKEDIAAQGLTSVGDVIQNLSSNGSALNTTFNNGGNGETRVSLRNLGSNRTLVLVNGKRWVGGTGLGGAVDLNTIPATAIERIDVLKDGASVTYGSDAIAGVVNVVLRQKLDGAEINVYNGKFDQGDGEKKSIDISIGAAGKKSRMMLAAGYVKEEPVFAGDRDISATPAKNIPLPFVGSSTTPFGRFQVCNGTWNSTTASCSGSQTRPDGSTGQFTYSPGQEGVNWRNYTGADVYNFAPDNYLMTPQERLSLFAGGSVDLTDSLQLYLRGVYNNRKSEQLLAAMPIVLGTGPGAGAQARTVAISANNLYNPFGLDISRTQRRAVETGGRSFSQDVTTHAVQTGLEGSFTVADRFVSYDVGAMYARNRQSDITVGLFNVLALRESLGPSMRDATGNPVCVRTPGDLATRINGCVPLNLLGAAGSITPAMLAFSSFTAQDNLGYNMETYFANASIEAFKLPGGMASIGVGFEKRFEDGFDSPDALIASGNTTGNARTPTRGGFNVEEFYVELALPLLKDLPLVKKLDLSLATRKSEYSNFGNTTNSKAGLNWRVTNGFSLRANWSEGFRAPSVDELYAGLADSFPSIADPCSTTFPGRYASLSDAAKARCHAQGVPVGGYDQGNAQIRISVGGNPNLKAEKSETTTLGFVFSPDAIPGFDVSVDWWKIKLTDKIDSVGAQTTLNRCIVDGEAAFCSLFSRGVGGAITSLLQSNLNFATSDVEGIDVTANYRLPKTALGSFAFQIDWSHLKHYSDNGDPNYVGQYYDRNNFWRNRVNTSVRWEGGSFGATLLSRYYSKQVEDCSLPVAVGLPELCNGYVNEDEGIGFTTMKATWYHDVSVYYKTPWKGRLTVGVNNVLDQDPPISYSTFANSFDPQYEVPGKFVYFKYSQSF
jgi:iron complex outermembrane recepter protein